MFHSQQKKHKKARLTKTADQTARTEPGPGLSEEEVEPLRSAQLQGGDLKDGLRMLILQEGKFWPARLNSTKLPEVYGVTMERQRGNRPIILPRDDILKEAVRSQADIFQSQSIISDFAGSGDPTSLSLSAPGGFPGLHSLELRLYLPLPGNHRQPFGD